MRNALVAIVAFLAASGLWFAGGPTVTGQSGVEPRAVLPSLATDSPDHPVEAPLRDAMAQWDAAGIEDYTITVSQVVFGLRSRHTLSVEGGVVAGIESDCDWGGEAQPCGTVDPDDFTVPGMFAFIEERLADANPSPPDLDNPDYDRYGEPYIDASFSAPYGVPESINSGQYLLPDAGVSMRVVEFTPLD